MTCIVGLVHNGKIYIGADSDCSDGSKRQTLAQPKVFRKQEFVIGCAGTVRLLQLIQYSLSLRSRNEGETDIEYLVTGFANAVRHHIRDSGYADVTQNREGFYGDVLIGYRGGLYHIDSAYAVVNVSDPFQSVGSGASFALGALAVMSTELSPQERIIRSLKVAAQFSPNVREPFHIVSDSE